MQSANREMERETHRERGGGEREGGEGGKGNNGRRREGGRDCTLQVTFPSKSIPASARRQSSELLLVTLVASNFSSRARRASVDVTVILDISDIIFPSFRPICETLRQIKLFPFSYFSGCAMLNKRQPAKIYLTLSLSVCFFFFSSAVC